MNYIPRCRRAEPNSINGQHLVPLSGCGPGDTKFTGERTMQKFIIGYGWRSDVDVIEAPSLDAAKQEAANRSMRAGLLDDDLSDTTFAEPYSDLMARDLGLIDERSSAPWWS